jgi:hypothetical protein
MFRAFTKYRNSGLDCFLYFVISQYYHKFNKSVLPLTSQSRRFFQLEVDSKHSESEWNQESGVSDKLQNMRLKFSGHCDFYALSSFHGMFCYRPEVI